VSAAQVTFVLVLLVRVNPTWVTEFGKDAIETMFVAAGNATPSSDALTVTA
jgi:hypothetical protein